MSLTFIDKPFSLQLPFREQMLTVDILPFYKGARVVYRVITDQLPELVIGLDNHDNWEEIGGNELISPSLLYAIGERIDHYIL